MRQAFWFNGRASTSFGMVLTNRPAIPSPIERGEAVHIPGRNGEAWIGEGVYDTITIAVVAWLPNEYVQAARSWLMGAGTLRFDSANAEYWNVRITGVNFVPRNFSFGCDMTVTFTASPFRYISSAPVTLTQSGGTVTNSESVYAEPMLTIEGSGEATIMIGEQAFVITAFPAGGKLIVDTEAQECYWDGIPHNNLMQGAFPVLMVGNNVVTWTGNISQITIDRRLRRI